MKMNAENFRKWISSNLILFDGAMGTHLKLEKGKCPEALNLFDPQRVEKIHRMYLEAGSHVITANTFGASRTKLNAYSRENRVTEINIAGIRLAKKVAGEKALVAASVGPTGLLIEPLGEMGFDELIIIFKEQVRAFKDGGADLIIIETMYDIRELKAAIIACKEEAPWLPVGAQMTFDENERTSTGTNPESFVIVAESLGVDFLGSNCSTGPDKLLSVMKRIADVSSTPLVAQPNAGLPAYMNGSETYLWNFDEFKRYGVEFIKTGVNILGGCCGTGFEHIRALKEIISNHHPLKLSTKQHLGICSRTQSIILRENDPLLVVGERINPTGKKNLTENLKQGKTSKILSIASQEILEGAAILDVNIGIPEINEPEMMKKVIFSLNSSLQTPLSIDSSSAFAIEQGLKALDGKGIINSVTCKADNLDQIIPLVKKYGGILIVLPYDENGIPENAVKRIDIASRAVERIISEGIRREDLLIDGLAISIATSGTAAIETLKTIKMTKKVLGLKTILGVSNVSFGLPQRNRLNAAFLALAMFEGLDVAIVNPQDKIIQETIYSVNLLLCKDKGAKKYISFCKNTENKSSLSSETLKTKHQIIFLSPQERLRKAIVDGDLESTEFFIEKVLEIGMEPEKIHNSVLIPAIQEVGNLYEKGVFFLPQMMLSSEAMQKAACILASKGKVKNEQVISNGCPKVVFATVDGDIHDIGKSIVINFLKNNGFEVEDLGKSVPTARIVQFVHDTKPEILALSALMTTTMIEMKNIINEIHKNKLALKILVGGAVVSKKYSIEIGADGYGKDAVEAVKIAKVLVRENFSRGKKDGEKTT